MNNDKWLEFYRKDRSNTKKIFIKVATTDGEHFFFDDYNQWFKVKEHCEKHSVFIQDLHLQFRSNQCIIDVSECNAIYLVRSILGSFGQKSKNYFTVGLLKDGTLSKKMYLVPEMILEQEYESSLAECFEDAIIYAPEKKKNGKEQVQT